MATKTGIYWRRDSRYNYFSETFYGSQKTHTSTQKVITQSNNTYTPICKKIGMCYFSRTIYRKQKNMHIHKK